jgi:hypothetical protein
MIPNTVPPRGIFVPTDLIFHADLPPAPLRTWMQLRCLAWRGWSTPPMSLSEIAAQLGLHPSRLSKHLAQLSDDSALSYRRVGHGKIIITFPDQPAFTPQSGNATPDKARDITVNSADRVTTLPSSYFPRRILGYLSYEEDDEEDLLMTEDISCQPTQNHSHIAAYPSILPALINR